MVGIDNIYWLAVLLPLLVLALMYFVRHPAHRLIIQLARLVHGVLRVLAKACMRAEHRVRLRNYELTKSLAETVKERQLERRFMRVEKLVERDLANYEVVAAEINQHLALMDDDYKASANIPRVPMDWVAAVEAVASLKEDQRNSEAVTKILGDMHDTVKKHHSELMREHRWGVASRHKVLSSLQNHWRKLGKKLEGLDGNIIALRQRLQRADQHMEQFELLTRDSGRGFIASMTMRFVLSLIFVSAGAVLAWVNFQLLDAPLTQLLPVGIYEGLSLPLLLTGLHLTLTLIAAVMVTESQRLTHFFPLLGSLNETTRRWMLAGGVLLLAMLSAVQATALFSLPVTLAATETAVISTTLGSKWLLAGLGFMMPIMLSLVVVPLEYFFYTVRPVLGSGIQVLLHVVAIFCRVLGTISQHTGRVVVRLYDVVIFLPLLAEEQWQRKQQLSEYEQRNKVARTDDAEVLIDKSADEDSLRGSKTLSIIELQSDKSDVPRH